MKKFTRNKKNPFIYEHGYHATLTNNIDNIINNGFILYKDPNKYDLFHEYLKILYNGFLPIYMLSSPYMKENSATLKNYLSRYKYIFKINVKNLEQLIDFPSLMEDDRRFNMHDDNYIYYEQQRRRGIPDNTLQNFKYPLLKPWFEKFNNRIPIQEFRNNKKLAADVIITTRTFCIAENIPPKNIEDIYEIKK